MRFRILNIIFILTIIFCTQDIIAQRPGSGFNPGKEGQKPSGPETPQEREDRMRNEAKKQEADKGDNKQSDKPLTKRQRARKLRKEEKERKKAYYAHQNRIQEGRVRYRMNKNEKKAARYNDQKHAPWWRKLQFNYRKKKTRR